MLGDVFLSGLIVSDEEGLKNLLINIAPGFLHATFILFAGVAFQQLIVLSPHDVLLLLFVQNFRTYQRVFDGGVVRSVPLCVLNLLEIPLDKVREDSAHCQL